MSNNVWPVLPGLDVQVERVPTYKTTVHETTNGKEYRTALQSAPRFRFKLKYNGLRETVAAPSPWGAWSEVGIVLKFHDDHLGSFDSFLYNDGATQRRVRFVDDSLKLKKAQGGKWWACELELVSVL